MRCNKLVKFVNGVYWKRTFFDLKWSILMKFLQTKTILEDTSTADYEMIMEGLYI